MRRSHKGNPNHDRLGRFASYPEAKHDCRGNEIDWENMPEDRKPVMQSEKTEEEYARRSVERGVISEEEYREQYEMNADESEPTTQEYVESEESGGKSFEELKAYIREKLAEEELARQNGDDWDDWGEDEMNMIMLEAESMSEEDVERDIIGASRAPSEKTNIDELREQRKRESNDGDIPQMPTEVVLDEDGAITFAKECASAFGAVTDGVKFRSTNRRNVGGEVSQLPCSGVITVDECAVGVMGSKEEQIKMTYHETFHLAANGCEVSPEYSRTDRRRNELEECAADVSAMTMCKENGITSPSDSYSLEIVQLLPRLKQSPKYAKCKTMEDFGAIFIADRRRGNVEFKEELKFLSSHRFSEGKYLSQYEESAHEFFDDVYERYVPPKYRTPENLLMYEMDFVGAWDELKQGKSLKKLKRNQRNFITMCIRRAMDEKGVL